jgi:hypothetical protein
MKIKICRTSFSVTFYRSTKFNRYSLSGFSLRIDTSIYDLNIEQVSVAVTLQACILHVLGSNLGLNIDYPRFYGFSSVSVGKSRDGVFIMPRRFRRTITRTQGFNRCLASPPSWEQDVTLTRGRRYVWGSRVAKLLRCVGFTRESRQVSRRSLRLGSNSHFLRISNYLHGLMTDWHSWWRMGLLANMSTYVLKYSSFIINVSQTSFVMWPCLSDLQYIQGNMSV